METLDSDVIEPCAGTIFQMRQTANLQHDHIMQPWLSYNFLYTIIPTYYIVSSFYSILEYCVYSGGMDVPCLSSTLFVHSLPPFPFSKSTNLRRKSAACIGSGELFDHSAGSKDASVLGTLSGGVGWVEITWAGEYQTWSRLQTWQLHVSFGKLEIIYCNFHTIFFVSGILDAILLLSLAEFGKWSRRWASQSSSEFLFANVSMDSLFHDLLQNGSFGRKTTPCHLVV